MTKNFTTFYKKLLKKFNDEEVSQGMEVEKEHDDVTHGDKLSTAKIVQAHLKEKPDYYKRLKKYVEN